MVKTFILDTNIILSSGGGGSRVLAGFSGGKDANNIVIPSTVLQELDRKKDAPGETGYNARDFIRALDELRSKGDITKGVSLERGRLTVETGGISRDNLPPGFSIDIADNRIISTCIYLAKENPRKKYVYVSNDVSCRCNADICFKAAGVKIGIESYRNDRVGEADEEYKGYIEHETGNYNLIKTAYKDRKPFRIPDGLKLTENEFVRLYSGNMSVLTIHKNGELVPFTGDRLRAYGVAPRNMLQSFALYALLAPAEEIPLVMLSGVAGTGKTYLALAAGMEKVYTDKKERGFGRIMISRNNSIPQGEELGFLKGTLEDKMEALLLPYRDALYSLLAKESKEDPAQINMQVDDLFESGVIDIFSLAYIRGRNIANSWIIVDEAQNMTRSQMRDLITRAADSKLVIMGDLNQIDNPSLDRYSSGFAYALQRMRGSLCAQVQFSEKECQRSPLAAAALERLK